MGNLTIISRDAFIANYNGIEYLNRCSRLIRGVQVAERLGAKYNLTPCSANEVVIYIKPKNLRRWHVADGSWVDVMDGDYNIVDQLRERPGVNVIAHSKFSYEYLRKELDNKIVLIPEHHCNFERLKRTRTEITTGGCVGHPSFLTMSIAAKIKDKLASIGYDYKFCNDYKTREDVVNFYMTIDFQVIGDFHCDRNGPYAHPNKIVNAASFGIPTIAGAMEGYKEFEYIPVDDMDGMVEAARRLPGHYVEMSNRIRLAAEEYHIDSNVPKYQQLRNWHG